MERKYTKEEIEKSKKRTQQFFIIFVGVLILSSLTGCQSVPGLKEPDETEINLQAHKAYMEIKSKAKLSNRQDWQALVKRVSARIAEASGEKFQWEVVLIESPEVNAWCMPGGKMAVYTGILPVVKNEAALAAVMGHEVAHATLRHGKKRYARAIKENALGLIVGGATALGGQFLCKTKNCKMFAGLAGAAAGFAVTFFDRKFSRGDESEADQMGQLYMAKAGYEPSEAIHLWERMGAQSKSPPEWMSTHPSEDRRKENLRQWLPNADAAYQNAKQKFGHGELIP
ncbi:MAG: M48 family metallopeptidase [Bdellovibrionales bacterium]|nr:M48 family metallopeptidase [Bdellovibrionales bacterium]